MHGVECETWYGPELKKKQGMQLKNALKFVVS
jgi:hypothetical protein